MNGATVAKVGRSAKVERGGLGASPPLGIGAEMKIFGIFLDREKNTENGLTIALPTPERVAVPLPQDGIAEVKVGQWVLTGSRLCGGSLPAHASVSGKVEEIKEFDTDDGSFTAVVIKADENQKDAAVRVPRADDRESFINAVRESGCPAAEKISAAAAFDNIVENMMCLLF